MGSEGRHRRCREVNYRLARKIHGNHGRLVCTAFCYDDDYTLLSNNIHKRALSDVSAKNLLVLDSEEILLLFISHVPQLIQQNFMDTTLLANIFAQQQELVQNKETEIIMYYKCRYYNKSRKYFQKVLSRKYYKELKGVWEIKKEKKKTTSYTELWVERVIERVHIS